MKRDVAAIPNEALNLPSDARAALAEALLASFYSHVEQDTESAWAAEIDRRVAELDAGSVSTIPWPEVRRRLI